MNLQQYTSDAIQTESRIESISTDQQHLVNALDTMIAAGNLLDVIKKDAFYGIPTDQAKLEARAARLSDHSINVATAALRLSAPKPQVGTSSNELTHINPRVAHAIIGIATEAVELLEALRTSITTGQPLDSVNLLEEGADVCWYLAILHDALEASWEDNLVRNINKLKARYPNKFTVIDAVNRDLDAERKILEQ